MFGTGKTAHVSIEGYHIFMLGGANFGIGTDLKEGVGCGVWGVGKETSFICGGENFFIRTDA